MKVSSSSSSAFVVIFAFSAVFLCSATPSLYDFRINDISGNPVNLASFKGKTLLIVNTASQCGYTDSHLKDLNHLQRTMVEANKPFEILAFPCNDFGGQEPWQPQRIDTFVRSNYQWQFPLMEKVKILGENPHPFWRFIIDTTLVVPTWNFHKYLFDSDGNFVNSWNAQTPLQSLFEYIDAVVNLDAKSQTKAEL